MPFNEKKIFCLCLADEFDSYIIVSFVNATLVLSIGETVEEVTDSGFLGTTPTLSCSALGDDALVQVYPNGIRHIRADKRVNEWRAPGKKTVNRCAVNRRQVVIALSGGELVYFEMDPVRWGAFLRVENQKPSVFGHCRCSRVGCGSFSKDGF